MLEISTDGATVPVPKKKKVDVGHISPIAFPKTHESFGIGTGPLGRRAIELGKTPQGCVTYTAV